MKVSAIVAMAITALLYGGDTTSTVANPIGDVLNALKDTSGNVPSIVGGAAITIRSKAALRSAGVAARILARA